MPCDYNDYHPEWKSISRQIKDQAGNRCEFCGVPNREFICRDQLGGWMTDADAYALSFDECARRFGTQFPSCVEIVLTVAHLCHDKACYDPTHLRALCQKCHLTYDGEHHRRNAAATRRRQRVERGQQELIPA